MKIIVSNQVERKLIESLCDVGLKSGGMDSYNGVQLILGSMIDEPVPEVKLPDKGKNDKP